MSVLFLPKEDIPQIIVGRVATFALLPDATTNANAVYLVEQSTGVWLVNRKSRGLYISDGLNWLACPEIEGYAALAGAAFTGNVSSTGTVTGSNLSNTNTGDETEATILSKMASYPVIFNPSKTMFDYDDFNNSLAYYSSTTGWFGSTTNSGSITVGAGATGRIILNTGTSSNGGAGIRKNNDVYLGYGVVTFECVVRVVTLNSTNNTLDFSVGIHNGTSTSYIAADGCYFNCYSTQPNWIASTSIYSGGRIGTDTDTGIAVSTNDVKMKIIITNLTNAKFYINGNIVATNTTNFPTNSTALGVSFCARQAGTATANRQVELDYYWKRYDLTTAR